MLPTSSAPQYRLEIILFGVSSVIVVAVFICVGVVCARTRRKKKTLTLSVAKYAAPAEHVDFRQEGFSPRTASVSSSTGSAATIMRQRSMHNRLESRLTLVRNISPVGF